MHILVFQLISVIQTKSINKTEQLLLQKITQESEKKYLKQKTIKTGKLRTKIFSLERLLLIPPPLENITDR